MKQNGRVEKLLLVFFILNLIMVMDQNAAVEGIFFFDLLCASRIKELNEKVDRLTQNQGNIGGNPQGGR